MPSIIMNFLFRLKKNIHVQIYIPVKRQSRQKQILELFRQYGILELFRQYGILELFWQYGILELFWQ
jgi:hypothetical protein